MSNPAADQGFLGPLPKVYQSHLVPLIFEPYAADLGNRLAGRPVSRVLEIAAGTGVVTRVLASVFPESVSIVASDLNQAMLDQAVAMGTKRPIEWRQADIRDLPWESTFDAAFCFGNSFGYLDRDGTRAFVRALARALKPGARFAMDTGMVAETILPCLRKDFLVDAYQVEEARAVQRRGAEPCAVGGHRRGDRRRGRPVERPWT